MRAWAVPDYLEHVHAHRGGGFRDLGPSEWTLVFDCETTIDLGHALRVGAFQLRHSASLRREGLFYEPEQLSTAELQLLREYAEQEGLALLPRPRFVEEVFYRYAFGRRALVVGFNLPFDITRLAIGHGPAKGQDRRMRGGFSIRLSQDRRRPTVQLKRVGQSAVFMRFTLPQGRSAEARNGARGGDVARHRGYFLDVATIARALLGRKYKLGRLAQDLETPTRKGEGAHGQEIEIDYLDYLRRDVQVTWECFRALDDRYSSYGLAGTPVWRILSEASIGKAYLRELGVRPWRDVQPDLPDWLIAAILESYYGGRCECRIRRVPVPGTYLDFRSQYPTVFVLLELWKFLSADGFDVIEGDPAEEEAFLAAVQAEDVLDPAFWRDAHVLCLVEPDGCRLPTRARYNDRTYNVAIAERCDQLPQWYTRADLVASKLHTGRTPRVLRVLRFTPRGKQTALRPVALAGDPRYLVDPTCGDPIRRLVELRAEVHAEERDAAARGQIERAQLLGGIERAMKVMANAIAYGILVEIQIVEHRRPVGVTVYRPDGGSYRTETSRSEEPGQFFHPLLATLVAAGGRLLLTTAMHLLERRDGQYAFCDTDSLFVVATKDGGHVACPGGSHQTESGEEAIPALARREVDELVAAFATLNPFDKELVPGSALEVEDENFEETSGERREIECLSLASKRYALFVRQANGRPRVIGSEEKRKRSEHGLGHLRSPYEVPDREDEGDLFFERWWEHLLCTELGIEDPEPEWFNQIALGKVTVSSPHEARAFRAFNENRPYAGQVKPFGFASMVHIARTERGLGPRCLIAPHLRDPKLAMSLPWIDRAEPTRPAFRIRAGSLELESGEILVQRYGDYFEDYRLHTEIKAVGPDGEPCHPWTVGLLRPSTVETDRIARIGKESNRLASDPSPLDAPSDRPIEYLEAACCERCGAVLAGRQRQWCSDACRKRAARASR